MPNAAAARPPVSFEAVNLDRIPRNGRMPINKSGWPPPLAVGLRHRVIAARVPAELPPILRIECLAVQDDFLRWIAHFTDRPLLQNERIKIAPFREERDPIPVRV